MEQYKRMGGCARPRILGLTASVVIGKAKDDLAFKREVTQLEKTMNAKVITVEELGSYIM